VREDPAKSDTFLNSELWDRQKYDEKFLIPTDELDLADDDPRKNRKFVSNSLSGKERNRLYMRAGASFADVSMVSGTDDLADCRSFALLDYNNDGWTDIALMTLNVPRFKLYQNEFGKLYPDNKVLQLRLVGGHTGSEPSESLSNRDAIGARIRVTYESGKKSVFQKQAGEGFGSQNSGTIRIGCPQGDSISQLDIRWPSGLKTEVEKPGFGEILTVTESKD